MGRTIPSPGLLDYEDTRLKTSSRVRKGLSLAWKASLAIRICRSPTIAIVFTLTFIISYLAVFIFSYYKNLYLPSILHLYHHLFAEHLFAELVHLYNLPLYWVCWDTRDSLLFGCRVAWERPSSSYPSHGLINLRSSTWGKFATVLQTSALGGPTTSTRRRLRSRHHLS